MKRKIMVLLTLWCLALTGCLSAEALGTPQEIDPTIDICPVCRMSVIDEHFAAQIIDTQGQVEICDDIGCLSILMRKMETAAKDSILASYVKDFESLEWIGAQEAFYVQGQIDTPMSFGIVAFATEESARKFTEEVGGKQLTWEQLLSEPLTIGLDIEFNQEEFGAQNLETGEKQEKRGN
ncbi:putative lipoprotein involved in nitrous oxide reduction [Desulfitobacterium dichloroeliminans LMG P-21439]|uniref:Putative lipoprotein involved in nitrous oxide reduction n=1 Tax=Desulfitobacterium dichloroeliminans (strain LMG P-21439 / DCA1) TaxID=871963 RepID=L0F3U0_DESDL|nr:nitrous oxide reductase accessory protein NosL [Desulfitobacterium dichloroeliminans]AGA67730.1 putative lipoprotein involved in nitrous oxide reduction [Desulfitobacterium dichloroeliminans LMG P-21439]